MGKSTSHNRIVRRGLTLLFSTMTATMRILVVGVIAHVLIGVPPVPANAFVVQVTTTARHRSSRIAVPVAARSLPLFFHQQHQQHDRSSARRTTTTSNNKSLLLSSTVVESSSPPSKTTNVAQDNVAGGAALERRDLRLVVTNSQNEQEETTTAAAATTTVASMISTTTSNTGVDYNTNVGLLDQILSSHWGVRGILMVIPAIYGTNFALGSSLNDALANPALTTALRMTLASLAVLPWLVRIDVSKLLLPAICTGLCSATGYIGQSIALNDVDPARVSFLGAAVVVWCPILEALFDKRPFTTQTWMAAGLCMTGVAILEGVVGSSSSNTGGGVSAALTLASGDAWALLQAIGFGTQCYLCSKFITDDNKDQVIPFTAVLVTVTAITAWIWYGLTMTTGGDPMMTSSPGLSLQSLPSSVWLALVWTGLISTSANFALEVAALGRVASSEATVFLSTEPIWAAIFAAVLLGNTMTSNEYVGGSLMILACLVNSVSLHDIKGFFSQSENGRRPKSQSDEHQAGR